MLDFGALPPEFNSALMYAGPGSAPLVAAASAWNGLAAELSSAATGYENVITCLTSEEWLGPASAAMAYAAEQFVAWLSATAAKAEQAAAQIRTAVAAYEMAFAAMVPPPLIAANRAQVQSLLSTNALGLNTPKIAALNAQYAEMWAQDAAAMYGYAGSSATAAKVTPFSAPAQIANTAGQTLQAAAVTQAAATSAGTTQSTLSQLISALPSALQNLGSPAGVTSVGSELYSYLDNGALAWLWKLVFGTSTFPQTLETFLTDYTPYAQSLYYTVGVPYFGEGILTYSLQAGNVMGLLSRSATPAAAAAGGAAAVGEAAKGLSGSGGLGGLLGGGGPVSAGLGNAGVVGPLSVPSTWESAAPGLIGGVAGAAPPPVNGSVNFAPDAGGAGHLLGGMPLAGTGIGAAGSGPKYGFRPTVMARPPFAG